MRAENGLEKNESENEDGVVEHSKEQELERSQSSEPKTFQSINSPDPILRFFFGFALVSGTHR